MEFIKNKKELFECMVTNFKPMHSSFNMRTSCNKTTHHNSKLGARVAKHIFEIDPEDHVSHVILANIYAAVGKWDEVAKVRKLIQEFSKLACAMETYLLICS